MRINLDVLAYADKIRRILRNIFDERSNYDPRTKWSSNKHAIAYRNPRYAPESLERKLSPSGVVAIPVAAEVYVPITHAADPAPTPAPAPASTTAIDPASNSVPTATAPSTSPMVTDASPTVTAALIPAATPPGSPEPTAPGEPAGGPEPSPPR